MVKLQLANDIFTSLFFRTRQHHSVINNLKILQKGEKEKKNRWNWVHRNTNPTCSGYQHNPRECPTLSRRWQRYCQKTVVVFMISTVSFMEGFSERIGLTSARNYLGEAGPALGPWMHDSVSPGSSQPHFSDSFCEETQCRANERTPGWKQTGHLSRYPSLKLG